MNKKVAIITTHPIQYYGPVFKLLAKSIDLKVFYTWGEASINKFDGGFKKQVEWDLPLLDGYNFTFVENIAKNQGTYHFNGIDNPNLIQQIESYAPNAVLIYGWAWKSHLKAIRHFKGKIPIYFRGDSTLLNHQSGIKLMIKSIFLKWVYRHVNFAFYVGTQNKAYFKQYGLKENQLIFTPHAIDNDRFSEDKTDDAHSIRKQFEIANEDILILFAGKLEAKKNPELLLKAFIRLNLLNVHLLFVGNGELEGSLKLKVESLGKHQSAEIASCLAVTETKNEKRKPKIHFMDFQNQTQMPAIYQACDLFCLPSQGPGETWGLAVNEAMACGKAILVSDKVGCSTDLIKPKINGEIFKSEDIEDLKNKLLSLVVNRNMLIKFGKSSQAIIQDWSFEKQTMAFIKTLNS